jgi:hypothetical protein
MPLREKGAGKRKTGARGLRSILEHVLLDIMFDLPNMENVSKVVDRRERPFWAKAQPLDDLCGTAQGSGIGLIMISCIACFSAAGDCPCPDGG